MNSGPKKVEFRDVVARLIMPKEGQQFKDSEGGCCGDLSPDMKVLELVPKLNEVIIEIVIAMSAAKNQYGQPMHAFSVEAIINSMSRFTRLLFPKANTADRRKVSITVGIEGQSNNYLVGDMVTCKANIERIKFVKDYTFERRLWISCVTARATVTQEFDQNDDEERVSFKTIMSREGPDAFKVLVFDGYGELTTSFKKEITVNRQGGNNHGMNA